MFASKAKNEGLGFRVEFQHFHHVLSVLQMLH